MLPHLHCLVHIQYCTMPLSHIPFSDLWTLQSNAFLQHEHNLSQMFFWTPPISLADCSQTVSTTQPLMIVHTARLTNTAQDSEYKCKHIFKIYTESSGTRFQLGRKVNTAKCPQINHSSVRRKQKKLSSEYASLLKDKIITLIQNTIRTMKTNCNHTHTCKW